MATLTQSVHFDRHLAMFILYIPFILLVLFCKLIFWAQVLYRQRASLSTIPGPRWAALSRLWLVKTLASGKSSDIFVNVNRQYGASSLNFGNGMLIAEGSLARIGPKHLITSDPCVVRRILAARSGYARGPWFDSIKIDPHIPNIVSERDEGKHNRLRYKLSASVSKYIRKFDLNLTDRNQYTTKNVGRMEPVIDRRLLDWLQRVNSGWLSTAGDYKAFDIGRRIQYLTVDIITKLCLGEELGCVTTDSDRYDFLATVKRGNAVCQHFSVLLEFNTLMYYFTKIPIFGTMISPRANDQSGVGRIMGVSL